MTAMKVAVSSLAAAMGANLDASAKQAEATNAAIHGLDESVKTVTDSIEAQTKTVTDLGTKQSKVTKEISKALETQNSQQKDANTTLAEQKKIMQEQEAEIKKVTKAVDNQTGILQKTPSGWKMLMTGFAIKFASEIVDGFKSICISIPDLCATRQTAKDCIRSSSKRLRKKEASCTARSRTL